MQSPGEQTRSGRLYSEIPSHCGVLRLVGKAAGALPICRQAVDRPAGYAKTCDSLSEFSPKGNEMRALLALTLFAGILTLVGCATLTETPEEYCYTIRRTVKFNCLEIPDDARTIMLLDRPSRLSRWLIR
jgi:hypothetical protein